MFGIASRMKPAPREKTRDLTKAMSRSFEFLAQRNIIENKASIFLDDTKSLAGSIQIDIDDASDIGCFGGARSPAIRVPDRRRF